MVAAVDRFWPKVQKSSDCWLWAGAKNSTGYGNFWVDGKAIVAHRFAYQELIGPIPDGLYIDHLCRNRACVNPAHLDLVTFRQNILRGKGLAAQEAARTHCPKGHPYDMLNTHMRPSGRRACRECLRQKGRDWYHRRGRFLRAARRVAA